MTRASLPHTGHASSMSSATPAAFLSAMSMTTTSARFLSATPRATVAPTFPAPPTTVTLRFMSAPVYDDQRRAAEYAEFLDQKLGELCGPALIVVVTSSK